MVYRVDIDLSTLSNYSGLFHSLFWIQLKRSVSVKGLNINNEKEITNQILEMPT